MNTDQNNNQTPSGLSNRPELSTDTNQQKQEPQTEAFGPVIYACTRAQALADGVQVDVSETAKEVGIVYPVFLTRSVFDKFVSVPEAVEAQDEAGRLWDILWMLRDAIRRSRGEARIEFSLYVRNDNRKAKLVKLAAECGPRDLDDPRPVITVMHPDED